MGTLSFEGPFERTVVPLGVTVQLLSLKVLASVGGKKEKAAGWIPEVQPLGILPCFARLVDIKGLKILGTEQRV